MRTLIAALTLVAATTLGSTAYAVPTHSQTIPAQSVAAIADCALSSLPSQASDTLELIHSGGPFPYSQDGTVFQNREASCRTSRPATTTSTPSRRLDRPTAARAG
ncbi:hypothetical protein ACIBG5_15535 [Kribbella sp. NPDC050241]|uniref:hypothetical protein n=1 Tax=Kribbella sp. NPDC050241 TaxID=3364115 RepID=UPI00379DDC21